MTNNQFDKMCIEMVEVCHCRVEHDCENCIKIERSFGQNAGTINYQNILHQKKTEILRLSYFRTDPELIDGRIITTLFLQLKNGHCDAYFGEEKKVTVASPKLYIIAGAGWGSFLLILIIVIITVCAKKKMKQKKPEESAVTDANPDYVDSVWYYKHNP